MSSGYGPPKNTGEMIKLIHQAIDIGVTFFDTAEVYGPFTNEALLSEALVSKREEIVIATKFGFDIDVETGERLGGCNSKPDHIKAVVDASLKRLKTDTIDLLYQHRVDPNVPIEDLSLIHIQMCIRDRDNKGDSQEKVDTNRQALVSVRHFSNIASLYHRVQKPDQNHQGKQS